MRNLFILAILVFALPAHAADWTINKTNSHLTFTGTTSGRPFKGEFKNFDGTIAFDPNHLDQSHVAITIDTKSVTTDNDDANENIAAPKWLSSGTFPTATFKADKFEQTNSGYIAHGALTLRGVTLPVDLPFTLILRSSSATTPTAFMKGETTLHRLDFGLGTGTYGKADTASLEIKVQVNLNATSAR